MLRWHEPLAAPARLGAALLSWPPGCGADLLKNKHVGRGRGPGEAPASARAPVRRWRTSEGENRNQCSPAFGPGQPLEPAAPPRPPSLLGTRVPLPFPRTPRTQRPRVARATSPP